VSKQPEVERATTQEITAYSNFIAFLCFFGVCLSCLAPLWLSALGGPGCPLKVAVGICLFVSVLNLPVMSIYALRGESRPFFDGVGKLLCASLLLEVSALILMYLGDRGDGLVSWPLVLGVTCIALLLYTAACFSQIRRRYGLARIFSAPALSAILISICLVLAFGGTSLRPLLPPKVPPVIRGESRSNEPGLEISYKPVLYLYPPREVSVHVQFERPLKFLATYPIYPSQGWRVTARPDGTLIDDHDQHEYSYLFWENERSALECPTGVGFVVRGAEMREFLRSSLAALGLTPREYNEFLVYWYPILQKFEHTWICFLTSEYERETPLIITPRPDTLLRLHMLYRPVSEALEVQPQSFTPIQRRGFTAIEWGGSRF
jgi:hypothetical protein